MLLSEINQTQDIERGYPTILVRIIIIIFGIWFWQTGSTKLINLTGPIKEITNLEINDFRALYYFTDL